jgi:hypothetical protein
MVLKAWHDCVVCADPPIERRADLPALTMGDLNAKVTPELT